MTVIKLILMMLIIIATPIKSINKLYINNKHV